MIAFGSSVLRYDPRLITPTASAVDHLETPGLPLRSSVRSNPYIFGLPGNTVLQRLVDESADDVRTRRALERKPVLRGYAETPLQGEVLEA